MVWKRNHEHVRGKQVYPTGGQAGGGTAPTGNGVPLCRSPMSDFLMVSYGCPIRGPRAWMKMGYGLRPLGDLAIGIVLLLGDE